MLYSKFWKICGLIHLSIFFFLTIQAQVTIGSNLEPNQGSLLDLKDKAPDINNTTASKGFALPRVKLTTLDSLTDINIGAPITPAINNEHTGLVIYNVTEKGAICPGMYVWNGDQWQPLSALETITDMEGNKYPIKKFGNAGYWMMQNLRSTYNSVMPQGTMTEGTGGSGNTDKRYYYPRNRATFDSYPEYGLLYTWGAASNGAFTDQFTSGAGTLTSTVQGICPDGWVLPSDYDWTQLEIEIATNPELYSTNSGTVWDASYSTASGVFRPAAPITNGHGRTMKSSIPVAGIVTATDGLSTPVCDGGGFNVLLVGQYTTTAQAYGSQSYMWSSSSYSANNGWFRAYTASNIGVLRSNFGKYYMQSIRCKKAN